MNNFTWSFLQLFANGDELKSVEYLIQGTDGQITIESKGNHEFSPGIVNKPLSEIVETDLIQWIEKDTTHDEVNLIKLAIENQINSFENTKKVDFPWLAGTFTI